MIEQFHFLRPWWLLALIPLLALIWHMYQYRRASKSWQAVVDAALLPHLLGDQATVEKRWGLAAIGLVGVLAIVALAGPSWEKLPQPVFKQQAALVIVLDLSQSMNAGDIKPDRLTRARLKIADILTRRNEGQTALIVYAAQAFTVTPLTDDIETINALLPSLSPAMMPAQGSRADNALKHAYTLFDNAGVMRGDILFVSDGFNSAEAETMEALLVQKTSYRISVLGVGSAEGGPIPLPGGGFLKDAGGSIVIARLGDSSMRDISTLGAGVYRQISADDADLNDLLQSMSASRLQGDVVASDQNADVWRELGPWLVLVLLPLVALAFRRGVLMVLLPLLILPVAPDADAFEWAALWKNSNQRAEQLFQQGDNEQAADLFTRPEWKASAYYRNGEYEQAISHWESQDSDSAHYNRGNALAKSGRLEDAIEAYEQTLQKNPQHADAAYNKKLVEQALEQQNQNQQDQNQQDQNQQDQNQQDQNQQDQNQQDQNQQDQNQQDQNQQDQNQQDQNQQEAPEPESDSAASASLEQQLSEQAAEQWLRKIPDDPGGLLKRKFRYQYQNRGDTTNESNPW